MRLIEREDACAYVKQRIRKYELHCDMRLTEIKDEDIEETDQ